MLTLKKNWGDGRELLLKRADSEKMKASWMYCFRRI